MISQNHRIVGVGRDLCGLSSPTLQRFVSLEHLQDGSQKFKILLIFCGIISAFVTHGSKILIIS